ncbi:MAG: DNA/RNA non-specific endonuclease [Clostridia bacterium]|nr:DNA/RNA non-specific endonuclease [Clostridia bacterium]
MKKRFFSFTALMLLLAICFSLSSCLDFLNDGSHSSFTLDNIPEFNGKDAYVVINENKPFFKESEIVSKSYEKYTELDYLGRCGVAIACVGRDVMPTEDRGSIGQVKPSGWHTVKYDIVDGKYLYNRCHLIGYQLTGENANKSNLITGTRYLNIEGMLDFENMIADYVKDTGNHVMYRVSPIFKGANLVASGVLMEAYSVEDGGAGIEFCVYAYNAQPGIVIDYANGNSALSGEEIIPDENEEEIIPEEKEEEAGEEEKMLYVLNKGSKKFHFADCKSANSISDANREERETTREELIGSGYSPCGTCKP